MRQIFRFEACVQRYDNLLDNTNGGKYVNKISTTLDSQEYIDNDTFDFSGQKRNKQLYSTETHPVNFFNVQKLLYCQINYGKLQLIRLFDSYQP